MSLDITIQLGDEDLDHFIEAMQRAQAKTANLTAQAIVDSASKLLVDVPKTKIPQFIKDRLDSLEKIIQLVLDEGYGLPEEDRHPDSVFTFRHSTDGYHRHHNGSSAPTRH